jgi:hypothetical protein
MQNKNNNNSYEYLVVESHYGKWAAVEIVDGESVAVSFGRTKKEAAQNLKARREGKDGDKDNNTLHRLQALYSDLKHRFAGSNPG